MRRLRAYEDATVVLDMEWSAPSRRLVLYKYSGSRDESVQEDFSPRPEEMRIEAQPPYLVFESGWKTWDRKCGKLQLEDLDYLGRAGPPPCSGLAKPRRGLCSPGRRVGYATGCLKSGLLFAWCMWNSHRLCRSPTVTLVTTYYY